MKGKGHPLKPIRPLSPASPAPSSEVIELRARLSEAEETLRAIQGGEVDSMVVTGKASQHIFSLDGAEHAYRVLIESMHEGALTLSADKVVLYANQCFARMVQSPLEQVMGASFRRFLSAEDQAAIRPPAKWTGRAGSKIQVMLNASDGSRMPVQISVRPLKNKGLNGAAIGMVVTDLTESRRVEELLRALTHRVVQVQEAERGRVALELHDHITQLLCAVLVRSQTLAERLSPRDGTSKKEAIRLRELLGHTAEEVERISRNLRPSVLDELGLVAVLRDTGREFEKRTGVLVKLTCLQLEPRLPPAIELTLFRILQEALSNVEKHARARLVTVQLTERLGVLQLTIKDDGVGFDPNHLRAGGKTQGGLGLLSMRERAAYVGAMLKIKSIRRAGTEIEVRLPLPPGVTVTN